MNRKGILCIALVLLAACACGCNETPEPKPPEGQTSSRELLSDEKFLRGIAVSSLNSHEVSYTWWKFRENDNTEPIWSLGQYCDLSQTREGYDATRNDLSLPSSLFGGDDGYGIVGKEGDLCTLTNKSGSKYIAVDPTVGRVTLGVDTSREYIDPVTGRVRPRTSGEDWVHMILEQSAAVQLAEVQSLTMSLDFTLETSELVNAAGGASQLQWIFSVHDKVHSTPLSAEYFWFNVTLYDNRYEVFPGTDLFDGGKADSTGKYIYAPTGEELFGEGGGKVETGVKYHVELDLCAYIRTAFEKAQSRGAMQQSRWEDLSINGFNLGWEVTNVSSVRATLENLSLKTEEKK